MSITFIYPYEKHLQDVNNIDPDEKSSFFTIGERVWVVQTYLRLKSAGYNVTISSEMPSDGIAIFHRDSIVHVMEQHSWASKVSLVCIRADRVPTPEADIEVVQNGYSANAKRTHFIPSWPQPGLISRDPSRGSRVDVLSYKGIGNNLHKSLQSNRWKQFLERHNLQWRADTVGWEGRKHVHSTIPWPDYRDVDVVVSLRSDLSHQYPHKPASKLINAWLAGVPAILGPEVAYQELRESDLDYIEACSLDDVIDGVKRLKEDDGLYDDMVQNGKARAEAFTIESIVDRWAELLFSNGQPEIAPTSILPMNYRVKAKPRKIYHYIKDKVT
jgi:hypothetical protein